MSAWDFTAEPTDCQGLAGLVVTLHVAVAVAPWVAGCEPWLAVGLSVLCLAVLPVTLRGIPGRNSRVRGLRRRASRWTVRLADGAEQAAVPLATARVLPGMVFCRMAVAGQMLDWWVPRYAMPADDFRRFKVALRCRQGAAALDLLDSVEATHREAGGRIIDSRRAN